VSRTKGFNIVVFEGSLVLEVRHQNIYVHPNVNYQLSQLKFLSIFVKPIEDTGLSEKTQDSVRDSQA
jgi:hypothetical protein